MKIRIEFTEKEKRAMVKSLECGVEEMQNSITEGNFGTMKYDDKENLITMNFKEDFIIALSSLMGSIIFMVKGMVKSIESFESTWLTNVKETIKKENTKEEEK